MGIYDLFDVSIGDEIISARPIEWSGEDAGDGVDANGLPVLVIKFNGTCPKCGQLLEFIPTDVVYLGEIATVICKICGAGPTDKQKAASSVAVQHVETMDKYVFQDNQAVPTMGNQPKPKSAPVKKPEITIETADDCPFQDPLEAGELKPA